MGFFENMRNLITPSYVEDDEIGYEEDDIYYEEERIAAPDTRAPRRRRDRNRYENDEPSTRGRKQYNDYPEDTWEDDEPFPNGSGQTAPSNRNNVVPMHHNTVPLITMAHPKQLEDAPGIADLLLSGKSVVVNMVDTDDVHYCRLLDFITGAAYMFQGDFTRLTDRVYMLTPRGMMDPMISKKNTNNQHMDLTADWNV